MLLAECFLHPDESKPERRPTKHMPTPAQWTNVFNPAFSFYVYYCYANLYTHTLFLLWEQYRETLTLNNFFVIYYNCFVKYKLYVNS